MRTQYIEFIVLLQANYVPEMSGPNQGSRKTGLSLLAQRLHIAVVLSQAIQHRPTVHQ